MSARHRDFSGGGGGGGGGVGGGGGGWLLVDGLMANMHKNIHIQMFFFSLYFSV